MMVMASITMVAVVVQMAEVVQVVTAARRCKLHKHTHSVQVKVVVMVVYEWSRVFVADEG